MSWDWKNLLNVSEPPAGPGGVKRPARPRPSLADGAGRIRTASIAWSVVGPSRAGTGGGVALIEDAQSPCPFCRGRGEIAGGSVCPVCNGSGEVRVEPPAVRCAFCGGKGQMPPRSNLSCWVCNGKGLVPVAGPVQTCPECQGRGKKPCESLYCRRCRGVGVVPLDQNR